jgi:phage-related minor tail protein
MSGVRVQADNTEKATLSTERAFQRLARGADPVRKSVEDYAKAQTTVQKAVAQGVATQEEANRVLATHEQRVISAAGGTGKLTQATGLARHEMVNLGRQVQDIGVSLASGQSPFTVLIQQGTQVADIFATSTASMSAFGGQLMRFASVAAPVVGILAAIGTAAYALNSQISALQELEKATFGVGVRSGATATQLDQIATASAAAAKVTVGSAQEMAAAYASTGKIGADNIGQLIELTARYARTTGQDLPEATKELAKAMADPIKGIAILNERTGAFDDANRQLITTLAQSGNRMAAQAAAMDVLRRNTVDATAAMGPFERAWQATQQFMSRRMDDLARGIQGPNLEQQVRALELQREAVQNLQMEESARARILRSIEAELTPLAERLDIERKVLAVQEAQSKARDASMRAGDLVRSRDPGMNAEANLTQTQSTLWEGINSGRMSGEALKAAMDQLEGVNRALAHLREAGGAANVTVKNLNDSFAAQRDILFALNDTERAAAAARASLLKSTQDGVSATEAATRAEQAYQQVLDATDAALQQRIQSQRAQQDNVEAEIRSIGMADDARRVYLAGIRTENELKAQGVDMSSEYARVLINEARTLAELENRLAAVTARRREGIEAAQAQAAADAAYAQQTSANSFQTTGYVDKRTPDQTFGTVTQGGYEQMQMIYGPGGGEWKTNVHTSITGSRVSSVFVPNEQGLEYQRRNRADGTSSTTSGLLGGTMGATTNALPAPTVPYSGGDIAGAGTTSDWMASNASRTMPNLDPYAKRSASVYYGTESGLYYQEDEAQTVQQNQLTVLQEIAANTARMAGGTTQSGGGPAVIQYNTLNTTATPEETFKGLMSEAQKAIMDRAMRVARL